ncbi:hypothetical protein N9850_08210 [Granulosicoccus sp.]|nr:hypothetical protein [Granulosicoccus sp.]MDB4223741.1 hypothetical protein [Granulosicoccus sp.]
MRILPIALCFMLASCGGGSSMPPQVPQDEDNQAPNSLVEGDDQSGQTVQPSNDDGGIVDPSFLVNSTNDFWICSYTESGIIYWQAPVNFHADGTGDAQFYGVSDPSYFVWVVGETLNITGQDLTLTLYDLVVDYNPISRNQSYIGELAAKVAEGGTLACSKSIGQIF